MCWKSEVCRVKRKGVRKEKHVKDGLLSFLHIILDPLKK